MNKQSLAPARETIPVQKTEFLFKVWQFIYRENIPGVWLIDFHVDRKYLSQNWVKMYLLQWYYPNKMAYKKPIPLSEKELELIKEKHYPFQFQVWTTVWVYYIKRRYLKGWIPYYDTITSWNVLVTISEKNLMERLEHKKRVRRFARWTDWIIRERILKICQSMRNAPFKAIK